MIPCDDSDLYRIDFHIAYELDQDCQDYLSLLMIEHFALFVIDFLARIVDVD